MESSPADDLYSAISDLARVRAVYSIARSIYPDDKAVLSSDWKYVLRMINTWETKLAERVDDLLEPLREDKDE